MNLIKEIRLPIPSRQEAWGTAEGARTLSELNARVSQVEDGVCVTLDLSCVARADVSFFREAVVELLRRQRPRLSFIAEGVEDADIVANLEAALAASDERLLLRRHQDVPSILGKALPLEYFETLRFVHEMKEFTSSILTKPPFELGQSTASARLASLWKAGLLGRRQGVAISGGREYRYFPIR